MILVKNLNNFLFFYCRLNRPGKRFCRYSRKEKGVFRLLNHKVKSRDFGIFPKGLGLGHWSKL